MSTIVFASVRKRRKATSKLKSFGIQEASCYMRRKHYEVKRLLIICKFFLYYVIKYFRILISKPALFPIFHEAEVLTL